jgi:hypothetical protein
MVKITDYVNRYGLEATSRDPSVLHDVMMGLYNDLAAEYNTAATRIAEKDDAGLLYLAHKYTERGDNIIAAISHKFQIQVLFNPGWFAATASLVKSYVIRKHCEETGVDPKSANFVDILTTPTRALNPVSFQKGERKRESGNPS